MLKISISLPVCSTVAASTYKIVCEQNNMEVITYRLQKWANLVHKSVIARRSVEHDMCIARAQLAAINTTNDGQYLIRIEPSEIEQKQRLQKINVSLNFTRSSPSAYDLCLSGL